MSLFGAMTSGVSGLVAQSSAMGAIADNITNVNTVGYKNTKTDFQSLVTKQTAATFYSAGGVHARPLQLNDVQGLMQASTSQTDMGISGAGYFVVNDASRPSINSEFLFTRAGSFYQDNEGYLRNTAGFYLQGWPTDPEGNVTLPPGSNASRTNENIISTDFLQSVNLSRVGGTASPTSKVSIGANLPSQSEAGDSHKVDVQFFDSLGTANGVSFEYVKTGANEWDVRVEPAAGTATLNLHNKEGQVHKSTGQLEFTGNPVTFTLQADGGAPTLFAVAGGVNTPDALNTLIQDINNVFPGLARAKTGTAPVLLLDGSALAGGTSSLAVSGISGAVQTGNFAISRPTTTEPSIRFDANGLPSAFNIASMSVSGLANGAELPAVTLDFGNIGEANGMTQFGDEFAPAFIQQNGARFGVYSGVTISSDGLVTALFDNGELRPIYKIPLATFVNPNGLSSRSGNAWIATEASGNPTLRAADQGPAGQIQQEALEASTVDIGEEFTDMIMVQRAYSAATKIISTADEMLEELVRIKR